MRLKYQYDMVELEDQIIAIPTGKETIEQPDKIMKLNKEAGVILTLLQQGLSKDQIVQNIVSEYDGDEQTITEYVDRFIQILVNAGHITVE